MSYTLRTRFNPGGGGYSGFHIGVKTGDPAATSANPIAASNSQAPYAPGQTTPQPQESNAMPPQQGLTYVGQASGPNNVATFRDSNGTLWNMIQNAQGQWVPTANPSAAQSSTPNPTAQPGLPQPAPTPTPTPTASPTSTQQPSTYAQPAPTQPAPTTTTPVVQPPQAPITQPPATNTSTAPTGPSAPIGSVSDLNVGYIPGQGMGAAPGPVSAPSAPLGETNVLNVGYQPNEAPMPTDQTPTGGSGDTRLMAKGGVIREPVKGIGQESGQPYELGEAGPETVTPGAPPQSPAPQQAAGQMPMPAPQGPSPVSPMAHLTPPAPPSGPPSMPESPMRSSPFPQQAAGPTPTPNAHDLPPINKKQFTK